MWKKILFLVGKNLLMKKKNIKQEMIDKACEAYCKVCDTKECEDFGCYGQCDWVKKFRKSMES